MIALTSLEIYNSVFNITNEINKFVLYIYLFDEFPYTELKDELEEILVISKSSPEHLQDKIVGPRIIKAYKKLKTERRRSDDHVMLLMGHAQSQFEISRVILEL